MTLFRLLTEGIRLLEQAGSPDSKQDAQQLLLAAFHLDMVHFLLHRMEELEENSKNQSSIRLYRDMIGQRRKRRPLQQILGRQEFMGMEFLVNRHVLIPRQDTESLVEKVLEDLKNEGNGTGQGDNRKQVQEENRQKSLLDLCTGSGCIAISLAARGNFGRIAVTDISKEALKVAEQNADRILPNWRATGDIKFFCGDLFHALPENGEKYDVITSNPPYIPTDVIKTLEPEVRDYEPLDALDGAADGLYFYKRIAEEAAGYLNPGGGIYLEIGYDQGEAVSGLMKAAGYKNVRVYKDLPGHDRVVFARRDFCESGVYEQL